MSVFFFRFCCFLHRRIGKYSGNPLFAGCFFWKKSLEVSNSKKNNHPENGHMEPKKVVPLVDVSAFPSGYFQVPAVSLPGV